MVSPPVRVSDGSHQFRRWRARIETAGADGARRVLSTREVDYFFTMTIVSDSWVVVVVPGYETVTVIVTDPSGCLPSFQL